MDGIDPVALSIVAFGCIFGSSLLGIIISNIAPDTFLTPQIREVLKSARDVIVGVAALTLGLLIATAKTSYDDKNTQLRTEASKVIMLDRTLYAYGPEASECRKLVRLIVETGIRRIEDAVAHGVNSELQRQKSPIEDLYLKIVQLKSGDRIKLELQNTSISLTKDIMQSRWMLHQSLNSSIQLPLLAILVFWLSCVFLNLGLMASHNVASVASLFLAALSMTGAIYLTLGFDRPYQGLIKVSAGPLKLALTQLMPI